MAKHSLLWKFLPCHKAAQKKVLFKFTNKWVKREASQNWNEVCHFRRDRWRVTTTSQSSTAGACFTNAVIRDARTCCWILNAWNSSLCQWRQENNSTWQNTNSSSWLSSMRGPRRTGTGANWGMRETGKGLQLNGPKAWTSACDVGHLWHARPGVCNFFAIAGHSTLTSKKYGRQ